jgi:uncharacterized phage protein (TIGR01671 family)
MKKLRAWDKELKQMIYEDFYINCNGEPGYPDHDGNWQDFSEKWIVMQSINLLDKNNKEIWEGDIVQMTYEYPYKVFTFIYEVKWDNNAASFRPFADDFYWSDFESNWDNKRVYSKDIEVIGNIHANPDLLTKDNT